jgi:ParB family chromosome partitioning protein
LGKGLGSLIPQGPAKSAPSPPASPARPAHVGEQQIDIERIHPNPRQPRQDFNDAALAELAASLRTQGLLQPILVRPRGDGHYELVAGERRWRAAQKAGLHRIPAVVRDVPDEKLLELALLENIQREELNAIEEAQAYRVLIDDLGLTQQDAADRVGKQRTTVANALRLLGLPRQVQDMVRQGKLTAGHARAVAGIPGAEAQVEAAQRILSLGLSVRQAEALAARSSRESAVGGVAVAASARRRDPNVAAAEEALQRALGAKVKIVERGERGRVEIHYFKAEELERVYSLLVEAGRKKPSAR